MSRPQFFSKLKTVQHLGPESIGKLLKNNNFFRYYWNGTTYYSFPITEDKFFIKLIPAITKYS